VTIRDKRILVTGASGQIAFPLVQELAKDNEVWGVARFSDPTARVTWNVGRFFQPASREALEEAGVTTRAIDLTDPDWSQLPDRFDHVMHFAVFQLLGLDFDHALRVNAEGTGMLMTRFADATSFLIMSTIGVYSPPADPNHMVKESDPLGDQAHPHAPTYSISKISQEAIARTLARTLELPTTIARMGVSYGPNGGLPAYQLDMMLNGEAIPLTEGRTNSNPIHQSDINAQATKLLEVATVPATAVNWAGDEVVTMEEYLGYLGELAGVEPKFDYSTAGTGGTLSDQTRRQSLVGGCSIGWRDGMRQMFEGRYPDRARA
jgi:nucleoside-diphosphate-sugar epimerase